MASAIEIRDLRVDYGDFIAVHGLDLEVPEGEVYGLVGPNGAGKTSTFKVLATLLEPTYGDVRIAGFDLREEVISIRKVLGYMPDLAPVPSDLKVREFLDYHAQTHNIGPKAARDERIDECLDQVKLADKQGAWCHQMSRGQTQRLVLAKTLLHRPRVMILDEPASGLDPLSRRELRHTLQAVAQEGTTVIVSSHILTELAEMCTSIGVLNQGKLLASGTAREVREKLGGAERILTAVFLNDQEAGATLLRECEGVDQVEVSKSEVDFRFRGTGEDQCALLKKLAAGPQPLRSLQEESSTFEEILVRVAEESREQGPGKIDKKEEVKAEVTV